MFFDYLLNTYGTNEPIFVFDITYDGMTQNNIRQQIMNYATAGKLKRYDTGIYYIPKDSIFKTASSLSQNSVIEKNTFIQERNAAVILAESILQIESALQLRFLQAAKSLQIKPQRITGKQLLHLKKS